MIRKSLYAVNLLIKRNLTPVNMHLLLKNRVHFTLFYSCLLADIKFIIDLIYIDIDAILNRAHFEVT